MVMLYPFPQPQYANERGASHRLIAIFMFLLLTASLFMCGFGIDVARGYMVQARLSRAVDAAALAGGRVFFDEQRDSHVSRFFNAAFPDDYLGASSSPLQVSVDREGGTLTVSASATIKRHFHELFGWGGQTLEAVSRVHRPSRNADPVLEHVH